MSQTQFVFLDKERVPSGGQLQAAINTLGHDLKIDPDFTPFEDEGFSPCVLNGNIGDDVGFEIFYESTEDVAEGDQDLMDLADGRDYCIALCWSGSFKDCLSVMLVSLALLKNFDAVISYEGESPETEATLLRAIDECLREIARGKR